MILLIRKTKKLLQFTTVILKFLTFYTVVQWEIVSYNIS